MITRHLKSITFKNFEYAATNKPILAGVSGFAAEFLKEKSTVLKYLVLVTIKK